MALFRNNEPILFLIRLGKALALSEALCYLAFIFFCYSGSSPLLKDNEVYSAVAYAYGVAAVFFFHIAINIAMTVGLAPVIGIPLPFISYGGTSLLTFTILLY